ncbi:MAG: AI-2E family transporter [Pedosphaera sp.]|nr:AI-2E family transporter [Pedosphaera sp.]
MTQPTLKQARVMWWALTALSGAALVATGAGIVWGLGQIVALLSPVLWPLAIAGVIAYLLDPVVDVLERRKIPRQRAILLVFVVAAVILFAGLGSVVPRLVRETSDFVQKVPVRLQQTVDLWIAHPPNFLQRWLPQAPPAGGAVPELREVTTNAAPSSSPLATDSWWVQAFDRATLQSASSWMLKFLPTIGEWLGGKLTRVSSMFGVLAGLALVPVYAFYFLVEKRGISSRWTDYLPVHNSRFKDELVFILRSVNNYLIVFFRSQVLVAFCDGVLYTVGFLAISLQYALLLGVMAVFLTMIPFLGAIATCVTALVIAVVQFGDWLHPMLVLVVFGIVQAIEGLVISPKIMGDRVGLHPLAIIIAVMVGTTLLGGILGGILAIPLAAALRVLMFRYVWRKRDS